MAICLLAIFGSSDLLAIDIVLRQKIVPTKSVVVLGDIADIHADGERETRRLALTPLWPVPADGEQRFVTAREVRDQLVQHGYESADLHFYGASQVAIGWKADRSTTHAGNRGLTRAMRQPRAGGSTLPTPSGTGFRSGSTTSGSGTLLNRLQKTRHFLTAVQRDSLKDQVHEALIAYLEAATGKPGTIDAEFQLPTRHGNLLALQTTELTISGGRGPWLGRQALMVEFQSEAGPQKLPLRANVWDTTPVVMARRAISRGQLLTAADLVVRSPRHDTQRLLGRVQLYSLEEALGKEASRSIQAGENVTADACLAPMMIDRSQIVTVLSAGGGIVVRRQAKALAKARQGEMAEVELIGTKERLAARVVGPGRLAISDGRSTPR